MEKKTQIGVNGYGTIGKRVADAIRLQDEMELVDVAEVRPITASKPRSRLI